MSTERNAEPGRVHVAYTDDTGTVRVLPKTEANARMQASAPTLVAAIEDTLVFLSRSRAGPDPEAYDRKVLAVTLRTALAQARCQHD